MAKKKRTQKKESAWAEAKRRCRLSADDVLMAQELGFGPASLIKNIPSRNQQWKQPVRYWVRQLYEKKFGRRKVTPREVLPAQETEPLADELPTPEPASGAGTADDFVPF
jgi:hypothetical protein